MKPYLIGFGLIFIGFCFGFFLAAVLAASGRASRMEEETEEGIFREALRHGGRIIYPKDFTSEGLQTALDEAQFGDSVIFPSQMNPWLGGKTFIVPRGVNVRGERFRHEGGVR